MDEKDLKKMQSALQSRFSKISKGFGKGLVASLKGGGIAGIALGLIDKLLNPLKEVQEAIEKTLKTSDDLATNAAQFNTSSGKLFKLITLARATGLDEGSLYTLITKFQTAVAEAKANPNDPNSSAVRNYTNIDDTSEAFFGFISQLQKMDKNSQVLIQKQVFGEKQILKMADFLQQDFSKLAGRLGIDKVSSGRLTKDINKTAGLSDLKDELDAKRAVGDVRSKANVINESMIRNMDKSAKIELDRENKRIASYNDLASITQAVSTIMARVEEGVAMFGKFVNLITPLVAKLDALHAKFIRAPIMNGIKGLFGQGKDD